jgi:hypothetical protein
MDQGSDDIRHWFEALKEVLVVSKPLSQWEALDILELHVRCHLGHRQGDGSPSTNAALNHRLNQCSRAEKVLLSVPHRSTDEIRQDVGGVAEGLYLHGQFCPKKTTGIRL